MLYRYIPWNADLLNLVITEGAHVAKKSEISQKWSAVNDAFFNQNEAVSWRDELYKKGDYRKLRDKYKQVIVAIIPLHGRIVHLLYI